MNVKLWSLSGLLLATSLAFAQGEAAKELKQFQGEWSVTALVEEGQAAPNDVVKVIRLRIKDDAYTILIGKEKTEGAFRLDAAKMPKTIDIFPDNGPERGKKQLGIYAFDGEQLKLCVASPGKERPTTFDTKGKTGTSLMVLKRAP